MRTQIGETTLRTALVAALFAGAGCGGGGGSAATPQPAPQPTPNLSGVITLSANGAALATSPASPFKVAPGTSVTIYVTESGYAGVFYVAAYSVQPVPNGCTAAVPQPAATYDGKLTISPQPSTVAGCVPVVDGWEVYDLLGHGTVLYAEAI